MKFRGRGKRWKRKRQRDRARLVRRWSRDIEYVIFRAISGAAVRHSHEEAIRQQLEKLIPDVVPGSVRVVIDDEGIAHVTASRTPKIITITGVVSV